MRVIMAYIGVPNTYGPVGIGTDNEVPIAPAGKQRAQIGVTDKARGNYADMVDTPSIAAYGYNSLHDGVQYALPRQTTQAARFVRMNDAPPWARAIPPTTVQARDLIVSGHYQMYERAAVYRSTPYYGLPTNPYVKTDERGDNYGEMTPQARIAQNKVTFDIPGRVRDIRR